MRTPRQAIIEEAAKDLTKKMFIILDKPDRLLRFGRDSNKHIDSVMWLMGDDVSRWWKEMDVPYRSLIRRLIWEQSVSIYLKALLKKSA